MLKPISKQFRNFDSRHSSFFRILVLVNKNNHEIMSEIMQNKNALEQACKEFDVKKLYVFGSYVTGNISKDSDLDFLVDFNLSSKMGAFEQFMGFKERLEEIYNRPVDLITVKKFRNPIFEKEVNQSKSLIYAA